MKQKTFYNRICILTILFLVFSCTPKPSDEEKMTLKMIYTDWSESVAITHLAAFILEEKMEYSTVLKLTDVESAYREIAEGEADIFADAWLPETHKQYLTEHAGKIAQIRITYPEARTGLVVPSYSNLHTVADLK